MGTIINLKPRQSNLELLRILAMLLIVLHHFSVHGYFPRITFSESANHLWMLFLALWGKLGVNLFVLITGFFCIKKIPKPSRLIHLWMATFFYSVTCYTVALCFDRHFTLGECVRILFPFTFSQYWFISCYAALFLLIPFINKALLCFNKYLFLAFIFCVGFIWSGLPSILFWPNFQGNYWYYSDLGWFIYLYSIAAYYRLYIADKGLYIDSKVCTAITVLSVSCVCIWAILCNHLVLSGHRSWNNWFYFANQNSIFILAISITIFILFQQTKIHFNKKINYFASLMLGVYLLHDNNFIRPWLWGTFWKVSEHINMKTDLFIIWSVCVTVGTFFISAFLEAIRILIFNTLYTRLQRNLDRLDSFLIRGFQ